MEGTRPDTIKVYPDEAGEWRWRRIAPNGELVSESGEGYTRKDDAMDAADREASPDVEVVVEDA